VRQAYLGEKKSGAKVRVMPAIVLIH